MSLYLPSIPSDTGTDEEEDSRGNVISWHPGDVVSWNSGDFVSWNPREAVFWKPGNRVPSVPSSVVSCRSKDVVDSTTATIVLFGRWGNAALVGPGNVLLWRNGEVCVRRLIFFVFCDNEEDVTVEAPDEAFRFPVQSPGSLSLHLRRIVSTTPFWLIFAATQ